MRRHWPFLVLSILLAAHVAHAQLISGGSSASGSGTVQQVNTTAPIGGGPITTTGTLTCTTCVTSSATTVNRVQVAANGNGVVLDSAALTYASNTLNLGLASTTTGTLKLFNSGSANGTSIIASGSTANWTLTLPASAGAGGQVLVTDGAGTTAWQTVTGTGTVNASGATGANRLAAFTASLNIKNTNLSGDATTADNSVVTISAGAVTGPKSSNSMRYRTCTIVIGADNGSALADADLAPQGQQCFVPAAGTIVEVGIAADNGTPAVQLRKHTASASNTNLLATNIPTLAAGAYNCMNAGGTLSLNLETTCAASLSVSSLSPGVMIETVNTSVAGGTAKRVSVFITWTVN